jgi:hypothetical protein
VRSTLAFSKNVENHIGAIRYFICNYNLTRTALSFSKKLTNHIGAIRYFIGDYNLTRGAALPG